MDSVFFDILVIGILVLVWYLEIVIWNLIFKLWALTRLR